MPAPHSVKARGRHGTSSLDLTVPAELKREHDILEGDVFIVEIDDEDGDLTITYERVHEADS
jgi:bifunctional DNA-binding transcriptional regulator/antitoxin component of YhaV-PrlF toxin-antitoxin module